MPAGSIVVDLLMRTGSFETDTKRATKELARLKKEAEDLGAKIGIGVTAAAGALAYLVKSTIDAADEQSKLAQKTGISVEALSGLQYASDLAGVSTEDMATSIAKLSKNMAEAAAGSKEQAAAFAAIGVSVKDANGKLRSAEDVLADIADRFASYEDGAAKAALAQEFFGKSGTKLIPLLNGGAAGLRAMQEEAERLGIVLDTETARAAEEFNDTLTRIAASGQHLGIVMSQELLPVMQAIASELVGVGSQGGAFDSIAGGVRNLIQVVAVLAANLDFVFESIGREVGAIAAQVVALASGNLDEFNAISDAVIADGKRARAELDKFEQRILKPFQVTIGLNTGSGPRTPAPQRAAAPVVPKPTKPAGDKQSEAEKYLETLQKQGEQVLKLNAYERALLDIQKGRLEGLTPALKASILAQAQSNDLAKQTLELRDAEVAVTSARARAQLDSIDALTKGNDALREEIALIGFDEVGQIGVERARVSSIRALKEEELARRAAAGATDETLQALEAEISALRTREELLTKKIGRTVEERSAEDAKRAGDKASTALADSIEAGILEGYRKGSDLTEIFINELKAQFAKTVLRPVIEPIAAAGNDLIRQLIGSAVSALSGLTIDPNGIGISTGGDSATGAQILGRRAGGGDAHRNIGGALLVGENGPELFRPSTSGRVLPNSVLQGGQQPRTVIENHGARIQEQRQSNGDVRFIVDAAVREVDRRISSRTGSTAVALKSAGLSLNRGLPRRGGV